MQETSPTIRRGLSFLRAALSERGAPWLVAAACALILAGAHTMQAMGAVPCELCLRQREPYWAAIPLAVAAGALEHWRGAPRLAVPLLMTLAAAALLYSAGVAVQHVGVIAHWWGSSCGGVQDLSIDEVMSGKGAPLVPCDYAPAILGVTLPAWNVLLAGVLAAIAASVPARLFLKEKPS